MPQPHKSSADDSLSKCHRLCLKFLPLHQRPPLNLQDSYTSCETRPLHVHRGCASPESWHGGPPLGCGCGFVPLQAFSHDPPLSPTSLLQGTSTVHLGSRVQLGAGHCHFWLCAHRVCVCVCVCFSKVLAIPYLATAVHTQGVATQSTASEHSQESGVPAGFRTRFSAFTGISTTQEGLRAALFTCPSPQLMSQFPGYTEQQVLKTRGI